MPVLFLAPLFLAAAAAVIVPIIVHLRRREQRVSIQFPSLMFLSRIPHRSTSRRRIHQWPLLLMRVLALLLIAAAFARPLFRRDSAARARLNAPARELVILIDQSYSMGTGDRFSQAKRIALDSIAALRDVDRATVIAFDASAHSLIEPTSDRATLRSLVNELQVGDAGTRYAPAIKIAAGVLDASTLPVRDAILISDMQRSGWDADPSAKLPPGVTLRTIAVTGGTADNLAIADITVRRSTENGRERVAPTARVVNRGTKPVAGVNVTLDLDGRPAQSRRVTVPASGVVAVEFDPIPITTPVRAVVHLPKDAVEADNERSALLEPQRSLSVLVQGTAPSRSLFLTRALSLAKDPPFTIAERNGALSAADLKDKNVVVLNDVAIPGGAAGDRLVELVKNGGGLVVAMGQDAVNARLSPAARTLLGAAPAGVTDADGIAGIPFGTVERSHPIFDIFRAPRSGDLLAARFYRHVRLDELPRDTAVRNTSDVLARFGDGAAAMVERRVGNGRVILVAAPLDNTWSDLPVQPFFLPLVDRMLIHAAGWKPDSPARLVGDAVALPKGDYIAVSPHGRRIVTDREHPVVPLEERGFYEVRDAADAGRVVATIASNVDVTESDLTTLNATELATAVQTAGTASRITRDAGIATPAERERRQSLWWYLMVTGFALLAIETVVSNRLSRRIVRKEA